MSTAQKHKGGETIGVHPCSIFIPPNHLDIDKCVNTFGCGCAGVDVGILRRASRVLGATAWASYEQTPNQSKYVGPESVTPNLNNFDGHVGYLALYDTIIILNKMPI